MKCKEMRIYFFLFLVLWAGSVYAQNQPVILDKHNVIELNDAKEWNRFIKSWEAVPLKMDARNAVEIQSLAVYDDLVVVKMCIRDRYNEDPNDWESPWIWNDFPYCLGASLDYGGNEGGILEMKLTTAAEVDPDSEILEYKGFGKIVDFGYSVKVN